MNNANIIQVEIRVDALRGHVRKLCRKNLNSKRVKCCATCPFEAAIVAVAPDLDVLFHMKRREAT